MKFTLPVLATCMLIGLMGCGLGNDDNGPNALRLVQEYKPSPASATILERCKGTFQNCDWSVTKTNEYFYRVVCRGVVSGEAKEFVFGVNVTRSHVMALNHNALEFTTPM